MTVSQAERVKRRAPRGELEFSGGHFVFEDVTWDFYKRMSRQLERAGQHARITFDQGRMEIMTTTGWHEGIKTSVARLLEHYSFVRDIPIQGFGNVTCDREDLLKGLQPDECYYIATEIVLDKKGHLDLAKGPPPDLAIEVQVTRSSIPKQPIYAQMGVPEVWTFTADEMTVLNLKKNKYVPVSNSRYFPDLDVAEFFRFVQMACKDQHKGVKAFDEWLRGIGEKK